MAKLEADKSHKERNNYMHQIEWAKTELQTTKKQIEWVQSSVKDLEMVTPQNHLNLHNFHSLFILRAVG